MTRKLTSDLKTCPASVPKPIVFLLSVIPWLLSRDYKLPGRVSRVSRQGTKGFLSEFPGLSAVGAGEQQLIPQGS